MPKPNNAYIAQQREKQKARDMVIMHWSHQMAYDAITLVLNDPTVMGKDVFGKQRLERICKAMNEKIREMLPALGGTPSASHVRAQIDRALQKICGEDFSTWEERYPWWDDRGI